MTNASDDTLRELVAKYTSLLESYVKAPSEGLRERAYLFSYDAIADGYGVLDVTAAHREALLTLLAKAQTRQESDEITNRASEFLLESLVPFEITHRGYRETVDKLSAANEELRQAEAALRKARDELEERVRDRTADLTKANAELRNEIAERKRAQEERERLLHEVEQLAAEAQRRAAELDASNKELEAFAYSVSHDLRAPLRHVDGLAKILLEDYADKLDEQGREYLQFMRDAAQRMGQLIDGMLTLSRVSRYVMHVRQVNLSEIAEQIVAGLRQSQPERQAEFIITPNLVVSGDENLLRILMENLMNNAWKFTSKRPKARIEFGMLRRDGKNIYYVRDNGAGFDMAYANKLFGAFQRLHSEKEFPGIGIGLATVQRIIRRLGGQVWAEGKPGEGATFYFTFSPDYPGITKTE